MNIPIETLKESLYFDEKGELYWKNGKAAAKGLDINGYKRVCIDGARVGAHRAVWALSYGEWPVGILRHVNLDRADNRIENLSLVTPKTKRRKLKDEEVANVARYAKSMGIT